MIRRMKLLNIGAHITLGRAIYLIHDLIEHIKT